uniref:Uncharacterized protein n=1 Tax=Oryza punctata TaxID=4537 RepID=A0A0E0M651_ORYPU
MAFNGNNSNNSFCFHTAPTPVEANNGCRSILSKVHQPFLASVLVASELIQKNGTDKFSTVSLATASRLQNQHWQGKQCQRTVIHSNSSEIVQFFSIDRSQCLKYQGSRVWSTSAMRLVLLQHRCPTTITRE